MTLSAYRSKLSNPVQINNFTPIQSVKLAVTDTSASKTFTLVPGTNRVTMKICNTGTNTAYLATGTTSATAVASSATVTPASSVPNAVATCDAIPAGAILTQDYIADTDTIAAICAAGLTTTLEISIGYGQ